MAGTGVASAYITLITQFPGIKGQIEKALGGSEATGATNKAGESAGGSFVDKFGKIATIGLAAVGGVAATGLAVALTKGFQRLTAIDDATAKMRGLGFSTSEVATIMDSAMASVRGTAFGLGDAAGVAAQAVAAGIQPGKELDSVLASVANSAAAAGTDLGDMGSIFAKVASIGKAQNDVLQQVADRGIPIYQALADQLGVTTEEVFKMASAGEIGFSQFQTAMTAASGTVAAEMGGTWTGIVDNFMASLGRIGEGILSGIFPQMKDGLSGVTDALAPLEAGAKDVGAAIGDMATWLKENNHVAVIAVGVIGALTAAVLLWKVGVLAAAFATNAIAVATATWSGVLKAVTAAQWLFTAALNANPIMLIVTAIAALVAGLVYFFTQTELGQEIWANLTEAIGTAVTWLWETILQPVFTAIGAIFEWVYNTIIVPIVTGIMLYIGLWAAIITWLWETILQPVFTAIGDVFNWIYNNVIIPIVNGVITYFQMWGQIFTWLYSSIIKPVFDSVAAAFNWIWNTIISPVVNFISEAITNVGNTIRSVFSGIAGFIGSAFQSVLSVVRGPINALIGMINGVIGGLNSVKVDIPDWVPGVGGQTFGLNIPKIPMLAEGGVISKSQGGTLAVVGEGRYDEAVLPLSPEVLGRLGGGGRVTQNITLQTSDPRLAMRQLGREAGRAFAAS